MPIFLATTWGNVFITYFIAIAQNQRQTRLRMLCSKLPGHTSPCAFRRKNKTRNSLLGLFPAHYQVKDKLKAGGNKRGTSARQSCYVKTIPKGLCHSTQGCEERATLGMRYKKSQPQRGCSKGTGIECNPSGLKNI
jgi:hypothetical protein